MQVKVIDIYSKGEYPANVLSNFHPNEFVIDGVRCASMEGFLQSLKFKSKKRQAAVCALVGIEAKKRGKRKFLWKMTGNIFWQGKKLKRESIPYLELITRAYAEMCRQSKEFRLALMATVGARLTHNIGKSNPKKTILTADEFTYCLDLLREDNSLLVNTGTTTEDENPHSHTFAKN
jgi:predicted NAD-dependent protein-ADP-ribosyltransferase YbiA (DUF1768 family)